MNIWHNDHDINNKCFYKEAKLFSFRILCFYFSTLCDEMPWAFEEMPWVFG
jgi:hypothetical protein